MRRLLSRGGIAWVVAGVFAYACGGPERRYADGGEGASDTGGTAGTSGAGTGGTSGAGTNGGTSNGGTAGGGGEGGEPPEPPTPGRPGTAVVAGGEWMTSTNYRMWVITGNGSLPVVSSSTNYRLRGGIVGTTQP